MRVTVDWYGSSPSPQQAIWSAQHFCVSEDHELDRVPLSQKCGQAILNHELKGNRGHWSVLDFAVLTLNCYGFPHSTMVQVRTHAQSGLHVLAQSGRYTGQRFVDVATGNREVEDVFYLPPVGHYRDRLGHNGDYTQEMRDADIDFIRECCIRYADQISAGIPYEKARLTMPYGFIQDFCASGTLRTWFHVLDVRTKADADQECRLWAEQVMRAICDWAPELGNWYLENRYKKAITSP